MAEFPLPRKGRADRGASCVLPFRPSNQTPALPVYGPSNEEWSAPYQQVLMTGGRGALACQAGRQQQGLPSDTPQPESS